MEAAWLPVALLAFLQAIALVVTLVILKRLITAERAVVAVAPILKDHEIRLKQLHGESKMDLLSFSRLHSWINEVEQFMHNDLQERIEEVDMELQAHLEEAEDDEDVEAQPTKVQARPSSSVHGRGRSGVGAAARRRHI